MNQIISSLIALIAMFGTLHAERDFFVLDNAFSDIKSPDEQAALLKKLGYEGICTRPQNATPEFFDAMERHGIKVTASYISLPVMEEGAEIPAEIEEHMRNLKGRGTIVWLTLSNGKATDPAAVATIRKFCDLAAGLGLEVVLYPHVGFKTNTAAECERLRKLADRPNLGISFNLCHFICQEDSAGLEATLKALAPHLKIVQIHGADEMPPGRPDWPRLVQPLGQGTFDMRRVIRTLDEIGYQGPVNLQCYSIKLPAAKHLAASMEAWKILTKQPANAGH